MKLIFFGLPGVGKSFVGALFAHLNNLEYVDGDTFLPVTMRTDLKHQRPISDQIRGDFLKNIIIGLKGKEEVVFSQTFQKNWMRLQFLEQFPDAIFVLVTSPLQLRRTRLRGRGAEAAYLDGEYLSQMEAGFEEPSMGFLTVQNNKNGEDHLLSQLDLIKDSLSKLAL